MKIVNTDFSEIEVEKEEVYGIFSESVLNDFEGLEHDYEIIENEIENNNPDFDEKAKRLAIIKIKKPSSMVNEDWILKKAYEIAKKYNLNIIQVWKGDAGDLKAQYRYKKGIEFELDRENSRLFFCDTLLGDLTNDWRFSNKGFEFIGLSGDNL
ncbi:hypothetical protein MOF23_22295 [Bacillus inaquosorum]|uniref:hypothetical protein n=1 Tax=Bacillus inaquosorum TaxID=483913 RepID=UPI00228251A0|nr:hypothetical protein [Bacillus inaquosorum]MCY9311665.1 hypothetical protein [Bacillus inaquosorum]MCY9367525.1 hypothetical protein [Bacillus spizizenii]